MPARSKVQDEQEVIRWMNEGKTYQWITEEYLRKYHIETTISMWNNFRRRHGLDVRINRDTNLIPWHVKPEHRFRYPVQMLRAEARRRAGLELRNQDKERLPSFLAYLAENNVVVAYVPDLEEGFIYMPREDTDTDIVRMPPSNQRRKATQE